MSEQSSRRGVIEEINGPIVTIRLPGVRNGEQLRIGELGLVGEAIGLDGDLVILQSYESTDSLRPGEPAERLLHPFSVELGPGLMGQIFDGVQRPLERIFEHSGDHIPRGVDLPALDRERLWHFTPAETLELGTMLPSGAVLGQVQETETILHRILVPPELGGELLEIAPEGDFNLEQTIGRIRAIIATQRTRNVSLPEPVPVLLLYLTAQVDDQGQVFFRQDIYKRDQAVFKALDPSAPPIQATSTHQLAG